MLSKKQMEELTEVSEILVKLSKCNDELERAILAATGNLCLQSILREDVNDTLTSMIDVPDFIRR